jgi:hypothetical protein
MGNSTTPVVLAADYQFRLRVETLGNRSQLLDSDTMTSLAYASYVHRLTVRSYAVNQDKEHTRPDSVPRLDEPAQEGEMDESRREMLRRARRALLTAPAVALLLQGGANAQDYSAK